MFFSFKRNISLSLVDGGGCPDPVLPWWTTTTPTTPAPLPSPSLPLRHPGRLAPFPGRSNVALHIVVSDLAAAATVSSSPALLDRAVDLLAGSKLVGLDLLAFFTSQAQHEAHED